ncbi:hypothetical protein [Virgibacillus ndiopensis]|uniref:hypothetical protein n=1 Tax=Virgibacillus ndiopensis TaxID=2004408 RepID=UPI000C075435|nr:hypothetical protein [Virgibacillus ndiopensis]
MAENIKVKPTPIQRNPLDVAMELTKIYIEKGFQTEPENLEDIYSRFYAVAATLHHKHPDYLKKLVPDELLSKIKK